MREQREHDALAGKAKGKLKVMPLMSIEALNRAKELLGAAVTATHSLPRRRHARRRPGARSPTCMRTLRDDPELSMNFLVDLTAVDYLGREPRFEVVYHLRSMQDGRAAARQGAARRARGRLATR